MSSVNFKVLIEFGSSWPIPPRGIRNQKPTSHPWGGSGTPQSMAWLFWLCSLPAGLEFFCHWLCRGRASIVRCVHFECVRCNCHALPISCIFAYKTCLILRHGKFFLFATTTSEQKLRHDHRIATLFCAALVLMWSVDACISWHNVSSPPSLHGS